MSLLRFLLAIFGGCAAYTVAQVSLGPEAPMATVGGLSFDQPTLWAIAGILVNMYMPEGWLKKIAQTFIKQKAGKVDEDLIRRLIDEADDLYPIIIEIYKRLKKDGFDKADNASLKYIAGRIHDEKFGVDFSEE